MVKQCYKCGASRIPKFLKTLNITSVSDGDTKITSPKELFIVVCGGCYDRLDKDE